MRKKIVVLWVIGCLAVSSAKAQFNTVSNNVCRYKVRKVEEKFLLPANQPVDSIQANLLQQETDSVDSKQKKVDKRLSKHHLSTEINQSHQSLRLSS